MSENIQPFRIEIHQTDVDYLHHRLANARWPGELPGAGWTRGVPLGYLKELAEHWRTQYDWRSAEARLNSYPQFVTEIDGQCIHFLHVRSGQPDAKPLLITHGFPSSVAEFLHLIEPLVNPATGQAFHVIAPSLPGYAFSTPLSATGWAMNRTARAWVELMRRLGYERYGVHGGDVGAGVSGMVAGLDSGYLAIQNSRPQTIGYGLADSPLLQLAWIAEKVHEWTDLPVDRDQLLTTVSLYWFTGSGATAAHTLYEQAHSSDWGPPPAVPQGFAVFGADETVRKLVPAPAGAHWTEFPRGRHFPAMEAPAQLAADLQAFFGPLR